MTYFVKWMPVAGLTAAALLSVSPLANASTASHHAPPQSHRASQPLLHGSSSTHPAFLSARMTTYRVQPGNTLGQIATMFHTTWPALAQMNRLANPNWIFVGQLLRVPESASAPTVRHSVTAVAPTFYRVQPGNTLGQIATMFHTTWPALAQMNHLANPNWITVGQVLRVPGAPTAEAVMPPATVSMAQTPATAVYRVQPGNTLSAIAAWYHTTWQHLAALNHLANPNALSVGEELTVSGHLSAASQAAVSYRSTTSTRVTLPVAPEVSPVLMSE